jgi:hypothetical protein
VTLKVAPVVGLVSFSAGASQPPLRQHVQLRANDPREYGSLNASNMTDGTWEYAAATDCQNSTERVPVMARCPSACSPGGAVQCRSRIATIPCALSRSTQARSAAR